MPLSLAERVRERRNQRLAASQQKRATNAAIEIPGNGPLVSYQDSSAAGSHLSESQALIPLLSIDTSTPDQDFHDSASSFLPTTLITPEERNSSSHHRSQHARALVSPINVPGKPPASPTQRALSAPSSPRGNGYPPSPNSFRPLSTRGARNLYNSIPSSNLSQSRSNNHNNNNGSSNNPLVTPHSLPYLSNSSPSWDENDGIIPTIRLSLRTDRTDRSVSSEGLPRLAQVPHQVRTLPAGRQDSRSVYSESNLEDEAKHQPRRADRSDIPLDERSTGMESRRSTDSRRSVDEDDALLLLRPRRSKMPSSVRLDHGHPLLPPSFSDPVSGRSRMGGTVLAHPPSMQEDDVSSLGGVEDQLSTASRTSLARLTAAVRSNTPKGLVAEERALWETFQASLAASRKAAYEEADPRMREKLKQQQEEQERSFRAIQRVLGDVSEDRDRANTQLKESKQEQRKIQRTLERLEEEVEALRDSQRRATRDEARKSMTSPSTQSGPTSTEVEDLEKKIKDLEEDKEKLTAEVDSRNKQMTKLKRHLHGKGDVIIEDSEGLKKELEERSAALENAKMIIASLENASGSLASDTRFKLKAKDSEIATLKTEARHQQKKLDNLATQLKEIQREKAQLVEERARDMAKVSLWKSGLREHLSDMMSSAVILEATRDDPLAAERFSQVVAEALETMQRTVEDSLDHENDEEDESSRHQPSLGSPHDGSYPGNDIDSLASGRSANSRMSKDALREVKQELEEKSSTVRRLEEELRKFKEEAQLSRLEAEKFEKQRDIDKQTLQGEIQMLRIQCNTNMELLTKKERELAVLRDSLKVEDDDVGYISDDATDVEDEDDDVAANTTSLSLTKYSASQTEAIAALLAHGRGASMESPIAMGQPTDTDKLRCELSEARIEVERSRKELKMERESLANAKMIISSLEKANKSMMEDLRSRLHESNSAITSLLEKSVESEKKTKKLETELEALRSQNNESTRSKAVSPFLKEEKKEEFTEPIE